MDQQHNRQSSQDTPAGGDEKPIRLLFFGHLPGITGGKEFQWPSAAGLTAGALLADIIARWPALTVHQESLRMAVDCEYVRLEDPVPHGSEVAVMPSVQGG